MRPILHQTSKLRRTGPGPIIPPAAADGRGPPFLIEAQYFCAKEEVSVVMQRLSYPTETVLSNKITE